MKLEVGKYYRTGCGERVGPVECRRSHADDPMPFWASGYWFQEDGKCDGAPKHRDIVAEWTEDGATGAGHSDTNAQDSTRKSETELERLVRVANEGAAAEWEIRKRFSEDVEFRGETSHGYSGRWLPVARADANVPAQWRVKPRPAFEPFYVNNGLWKVSLSDGGHSDTNGQPTVRGAGSAEQSVAGKTLSVGCQTFDARRLYNALDDILCKKGYWNAALKIHSTRDGLRYGDYVLSWPDADSILAALEKALGKEAA
jgi:hypothetical protein